jgi:hypothetical protein
MRIDASQTDLNAPIPPRGEYGAGCDAGNSGKRSNN